MKWSEISIGDKMILILIWLQNIESLDNGKSQKACHIVGGQDLLRVT